MPGAVFGGTVYGGGALELAAGTAAGTVTLGKSFSGFQQITIDQGAAWEFAGSDSLTAGQAVDDAGTLLAVGSAGLTIDGAVSGAGTIAFGGGGLVLDGRVAAGQNLAFGGSGETLELGDASSFSGTVENFAAGDTIDLTGVARNLVTGVSFSAGVLTVSEAFASYTITFANPGSFVGETFKAFADHGGTGITLSGAAAIGFLAPAAVATHYLRAPAQAVAGARSAGWMDGELFAAGGSLGPMVTLH
jgi:hypothetical protein